MQTMDTPDGGIVRWSAKPRSRNTRKEPNFAQNRKKPAKDLTLYKPYPYEKKIMRGE